MEKKISSAVIHRMPRYFRHLCDLHDAGITRISSMRKTGTMTRFRTSIR